MNGRDEEMKEYMGVVGKIKYEVMNGVWDR